MRPPKIHIYDLATGVNVDNKGVPRVVDEFRVEPFGLYMSRPMVDRRTVDWVESWLLPDLGVCVTDWWWKPGHERDQDFYLDIAAIERGAARWRMTDLYLDVVVCSGRKTQVIDVDEFVAAISTGMLDGDLAEYAMHRAYDVVAALAVHGHDVDAWLATLGITLRWRRR